MIWKIFLKIFSSLYENSFDTSEHHLSSNFTTKIFLLNPHKWNIITLMTTFIFELLFASPFSPERYFLFSNRYKFHDVLRITTNFQLWHCNLKLKLKLLISSKEKVFEFSTRIFESEIWKWKEARKEVLKFKMVKVTTALDRAFKKIFWQQQFKCPKQCCGPGLEETAALTCCLGSIAPRVFER